MVLYLLASSITVLLATADFGALKMLALEQFDTYKVSWLIPEITGAFPERQEPVSVEYIKYRAFRLNNKIIRGGTAYENKISWQQRIKSL
jgi:hypothetical protein